MKILDEINFKDALVFSKRLLENENWDITVQEYAVKVIEKVKEKFPEAWNSNWKHEAFLGYAYSILGTEPEKEFDAFFNAASSSKGKSPEVLMQMAKLWSSPGVYKKKISKEKAVEILEEIACTCHYIEAIEGVKSLYEEVGNIDKAAEWDNFARNYADDLKLNQYPYLDFLDEYANHVE